MADRSSPFDYPWLLVSSVFGRLPYGMAAVALLTVADQRHYGGVATGLLPACFTTTFALMAPFWGRLIDRRGPRDPFLACVLLHTGGVALIALTRDPGPAALGGVLVGAGTPPVAAAMRVTWNRLLPSGSAQNRANTLESILAEGVHIVGRILVALLSTVGGTLLVSVQGVLMIVGGTALALNPHFHGVGSAISGRFVETVRRGAGLYGLVLTATVAHGAVATAVVVGSPSRSEAWGAVLMALWGAGSATGGYLFLRVMRGDEVRRLVTSGLVLFALLCPPVLACYELGLSSAAVATFVLGLPLAPTFSGLYGLAGRVAAPGRENETFALVSSTVVIGFGVGTTAAGALSGALTVLVAGFGLATVATALAVPLAVHLERPPP